jgi:hypothetical protein
MHARLPVAQAGPMQHNIPEFVPDQHWQQRRESVGRKQKDCLCFPAKADRANAESLVVPAPFLIELLWNEV